ncbi:MAG: DUF177 domain-containing protein [Chloroflexi bacterium]|nr:DUF177 domain-containing protein [Chloroflexota bacterium]
MDTSNTDLVFNVAQLLKEPVGAIRKYSLDTPLLVLAEESSEDGSLAAYDLHGSVKVTRMSRDLLVQGDVEASVSLECSRCLEQFRLPVDAMLEELFQPTLDVETGRPVQLDDSEKDDTAFHIDQNHLMDLSEPVRQALLVALPLKPLCKEECAGLCPHCGANLNETQCGCESEDVDSRWQGLRELKLGDLPAGDLNIN